MAVNFALFLSPEGIALAHRQPAGHWAFVAETRIDVDDLDAALSDLRAQGAERGGDAFETLLVLPDDQVLYTSLMAPTDDPSLTVARIEEGLDGLTPYAVADLSYDYRAVEVDRVKIAVVAHETLDEARAFAESHGFNGVGFAAMPPTERFPGLPVFDHGTTVDLGLPQDGLAFGADAWSAEQDTTTDAETDVTDDGKSEEETAVSDGQHPADEASSKRTETVEPDSVVAEDASQPDTAAAPNDESAPASGDPLPNDETAPSAGVEADTAEQGETPSIPEDSAPMQASLPLDDDAGAADSASQPDDVTADTEATPAPEPEAEDTPNAEPDTKPTPKLKRATRAPKKTTAPKPAKDISAPSPDATQDNDASSDGSAGPPLPSFGARRGKAPAASEIESGKIVGTRSSRLAFGAETTPKAAKPLHPDVTTRATPSSGAPSDASGVKGNLATRLERVRDASKARPPRSDQASGPTIAATPKQSSETPLTAQLPQTARTPLDAEASTAKSSTQGGLLTGLLRPRRRAGSNTATQASASAALSGDGTDATLTSGLLARKPSDAAGPSFKTGLVLTVILLVLLAVIAIWSVVFLPNSPMARIFGGSEDVAVSDPPNTPAPPDALIASPAIGEQDGAIVQAPEQTPVQRPDDVVVVESEDVEPPTETELAALEPEAEAPAPDVERVPAPDVAADIDSTLPDIDADLDLPPLPPMPQDLLPSLEDTQRIYAEDGVWPRTPDRPELRSFDTLDQVFIAAIDPDVPGFDALALPDPATDFDEQFRRVPLPPPFGTTFAVNPNGLVDATPDGVLTPEGAFVIAGAPPIAAIPRPRSETPVVAPTEGLQLNDAILSVFRPTPRPGDLDEVRERQLLGGLTVTELAERRPQARPVSAQEAAARASLFPSDEADDTTTAAPAVITGGTQLAVASSRMPRLRPANIDAIVAAAQRAPAPSSEVAAVPASVAAPQPSIPSNASVTRAATERNVMRLRDVNLIGVTGSPSDRRALVRLPSGRFVRVGVGDRLDGGTVAAIGEGTLQYVRRGRNITLEIPG